MKDYIYIIAEYVGGLPSFRHEFIVAESEEQAYLVGYKTVRQPELGHMINDYVIELSAK